MENRVKYRVGTSKGELSAYAVNVIEKAVSEADALIRARLAEAGVNAPHIVLAITPTGAGAIRSNCRASMLTDVADGLRRIAIEHDAKEKPRH